jgi:hypothetical protein
MISLEYSSVIIVIAGCLIPISHRNAIYQRTELLTIMCGAASLLW